MKIDQDDIRELIFSLSEGLNVEVKSWLDPSQPAGVAKIVKAALALRNRNGGYLVVGFDNKMTPDKGNEPADVRGAFQLDTIQGIVSRYASTLFEIGVVFAALNGQEYPVIVIPEGVRTPVAAKRSLVDPGGKELIKPGDVYFRTLSSNGTPSSSLMGPQDWGDLLDVCFENREADIGRFLRRHLGGDLSAFATALIEASASRTPPPPSLRERTKLLLNEGDKRFRAALKESPHHSKIDANTGTWSVALVIDPGRPNQLPDDNFLNVVATSNPRYIGWPVWLDSRTFTDRSMAPIVKEGAWQTLIVSFGDWTNHVDFFRWVPSGEFYLERIFQDDLVDKIQPKTLLDPILVILRTAEVIAVGLTFARALGWEPETTRLSFGFRWTRLAGRTLDSWSNPMVPISSHSKAHDDSVDTYVEVPLETPVNAIAPYVEQAIRGLFVLFGGYVMPSAVIEHWVQRLIERKL
jgi:hypothetical protein